MSLFHHYEKLPPDGQVNKLHNTRYGCVMKLPFCESNMQKDSSPPTSAKPQSLQHSVLCDSLRWLYMHHHMLKQLSACPTVACVGPLTKNVA